MSLRRRVGQDGILRASWQLAPTPPRFATCRSPSACWRCYSPAVPLTGSPSPPIACTRLPPKPATSPPAPPPARSPRRLASPWAVTASPAVSLAGTGPVSTPAPSTSTMAAAAVSRSSPPNSSPSPPDCTPKCSLPSIAASACEPEELVLAATHTHHGPANFASAEIYNSFAGPLPNFDPELLDFLADRIAGAIVDSIADARAHAAHPARIALLPGKRPGHPAQSRHRPLLRQPGSPSYQHPEAEPRSRRVLSGRQSPTAAHAIWQPTPLCNSSRSCATALPARCSSSTPSTPPPSPTTPTFTPATSPASPAPCSKSSACPSPVSSTAPKATSRRIGSSRTATMPCVSAAGSPRQPPPFSIAASSIPMRIRRIEVRRKIVPNHWRDADGIGFVSKPMSGAAEFGGAEDGRTIFYNYGWRAEARKSEPAGEHGSKEPGLDGPLAGAMEALDSRALARAVRLVRPARFLSRAIFPALVPVTWARLGDFTLAAIPVEATTAAGWAIRQQARADVIVGLANEYIGYTASAPEYALQQYEGASTLLGPGSGRRTRPPPLAGRRRPWRSAIRRNRSRAKVCPRPATQNWVRFAISAGSPQAQHGRRRPRTPRPPGTAPHGIPHPTLRLERRARRRLAFRRPPDRHLRLRK